jgi:hypothetical protein
LARRFADRFPNIAHAGEGSDWLYAGWYVEMLHLTFPNRLPIAFTYEGMPRGNLPTISIGPSESEVVVPLPPPGECG